MESEPSESRYHARVEFKTVDDGTHRILIDGHDVSNAVLTDGFRLYFEPFRDANGKLTTSNELILQVSFAVDQIDADIQAILAASSDADGGPHPD